MKGLQFFWGLLILVLIVGLVLRYGNSSHLIASDFNRFISTVTLQNPGTQYYGPTGS